MCLATLSGPPETKVLPFRIPAMFGSIAARAWKAIVDDGAGQGGIPQARARRRAATLLGEQRERRYRDQPCCGCSYA